MACELTTGVSVGCKDSAGGIKEVYFANKSNVSGITVTADGTVSGITNSGSWYKYEPRNATSAMMDNPQVNRQNGTAFYQQGVNLVLTKMEQAKRNEIILLAKANMHIIVKDQNDKYWLLGQDNGMEMENSEVGTGTELGDRNGYTLNFEGKEPEAAPEIQYAAFSADVSVTQI